jgi:hypothetical protein
MLTIQGDRSAPEQQTITVSPGDRRPIDVRLPPDQPFHLRLQTARRSNAIYDWAIWEAPSIGPCAP